MSGGSWPDSFSVSPWKLHHQPAEFFGVSAFMAASLGAILCTFPPMGQAIYERLRPILPSQGFHSKSHNPHFSGFVFIDSFTGARTKQDRYVRPDFQHFGCQSIPGNMGHCHVLLYLDHGRDGSAHQFERFHRGVIMGFPGGLCRGFHPERMQNHQPDGYTVSACFQDFCKSPGWPPDHSILAWQCPCS